MGILGIIGLIFIAVVFWKYVKILLGGCLSWIVMVFLIYLVGSVIVFFIKHI